MIVGFQCGAPTYVMLYWIGCTYLNTALDELYTFHTLISICLSHIFEQECLLEQYLYTRSGEIMTLVKEIFEAEKKADDIIKNAEVKKEEKIAKARQKTISELAEGKKKIESAVDKTVKAALKKIELRKERILSAYHKQVDDVEKKADREKAVRFVLEKVMDAEDL